MDSDARCLCDHKNNAHSDSGCQWPDCRCKEWRENKPVNLDVNVKTSVNTTTRKLAERFEKMTSHKTRLKKDSDELKMQKIIRSSKSSKSEKFDLEENMREALQKLNKKEEWKKIDQQLEMRLKLDHENVNMWIEKGQNFLNWGKNEDAIYCFKNALMFENKQDNTFDKKNYQILYSLGKIYFERKEYPEAIKYFEDSLKIKPEYIHALNQLGIIYINLSDDKKAKECFTKILEYKPEDTIALSNLGLIHENNEEYKEAIKLFNKVRELKDDNDTNIYAETHEAYCYYCKKDLEHADLLINKEKIKKNETSLSYRVRGDICLEAEKYDDAIENFEKEFGWTDIRNRVWADLGYCHQQIGNYEVCIVYYLKFLENTELAEWLAQNLGDAYDSLGQYENSLKWYNLGLEKFPGNTDILLNKAILYQNQVKWNDAINCYDKILEKEPEHLGIMRRKAGCMTEIGEHHDAIKLLEEIQKKIANPKNVMPKKMLDHLTDENLLNGIGWDWIQIGEYKKGLKFVEQALAINPEKGYIIDSKAEALKKLGRFKEAKEWYEKAFEIDKQERQKMEIGICHRKAGNTLTGDGREKHNVEAIKIFDSILEKNNSSSDAWYQKSLCYWNLKQYDDGKNCLVNAIKINPHKKEYWLELGEISNKQIKPIQAILYFDKSIKIKATSEDYRGKSFALGKLEKYDDAIECMNDAIKRYDQNKTMFDTKFIQIAEMWEEKGLLHQKKENYKDAVDCYDKALELEPKYDLALMNKGNSLRIMKEYSDAIECLNEAIKISPKDYYPHHRKILAYQDWEKYLDAIKLAEEALEQFPEESERTLKVLVDICEETGDKIKQKEWEKKLQEIRDLKDNETDGV